MNFIKLLSYFRLKLSSSNLTWCVHPLMNSFHLFVNRLPLNYSRKCNFSAKHSGQKLVFVLPCTFLTIDHLIVKVIWSSFNNHIYFDNSVLFFLLFVVKIFIVISSVKWSDLGNFLKSQGKFFFCHFHVPFFLHIFDI